MKGRRGLLHLLAASVIFLGSAALLVFLADPFFHYHEPWFGLKAVEDTKEYQVPGILTNFSYDSVLAGSSVVMSMDTERLDERFSCKTVKAVGGSASAPLLDYYLDLAFEGREIKYVFYGLDVFSFYNAPDMQVVDDDVQYLVNENPFDDIEYLWNMDIIGESIPNMILKSKEKDYREGLIFQLNHEAVLGPDAVLSMHCPGGAVQEEKPLDFQGEFVTENINRLEERVKAYPDTQFLFFVPPYNIVWWDDAYEKGILGTYMHTLETCMERLLPYENVRFYRTGFNEKYTICDMYQYMDYIHGGVMVTQRMAEQVGSSEEEITLENYKQEITLLLEVFHEFRNRVETEGYGFVYEWLQ